MNSKNQDMKIVLKMENNIMVFADSITLSSYDYKIYLVLCMQKEEKFNIKHFLCEISYFFIWGFELLKRFLVWYYVHFLFFTKLF